LHDCVYSADYPESYLHLKMLILFDAYDQCCGAYRCDPAHYVDRGDAPEPEPGHPLPVGPAKKCAVGPGTAGLHMEACSETEYCRLDVGTCDPPAPGYEMTEATIHYGLCAPASGDCPFIMDPVCGCDGEEYSNSCVAGSKGVSVWHRGPCRAARE